MRLGYKYSILMAALIISNVNADNQVKNKTKEEKKSPWGFSAHIGGVLNTGNTRNNNLNAKIVGKYTKEKWKNELTVKGQLSSNREALSASRLDLFGESSYFFRKRQFFYTNGRATFDRFDPYTYTLIGVIGYGLRVIDSERISLDMQVGPGVRANKVSGTGERRQDFIIQPKSTFRWKITEGTEFKQSVVANIGKLVKRFSKIETETALKTNVVGNLGMELAFNTDYYSSIPAMSKNTVRLDTTTTVNLVYSF